MYTVLSWSALGGCGLFYLILITIGQVFPRSNDEYYRVDQGHGCVLSSGSSPMQYYKDGDILIGAILKIFFITANHLTDFQNFPDQIKCVGPTFKNLNHLLAFIYAVEEINNNTDFLPNITLGYHIYDVCASEVLALKSIFNLLSNKETPSPNFICHKKRNLVAFVGHLLSSTTYTIAQISQLYKYPQISYGAVDSLFNNRLLYPSFFRTVPTEYSQFETIVQLLIHFGWTWVGIVAANEDSYLQASDELIKEMRRGQICVQFKAIIAIATATWYKTITNTLKVIEHSTARVIILYLGANQFIPLLLKAPYELILKRLWIASVTMDIITDYKFKQALHSFNGSLLISIPEGDIPGFSDFMPQFILTNKNTFIQSFWNFNLGCTQELQLRNNNCSKKKILKEFLSQNKPSSYRITHAIYMSVYALAYALHNMNLATELLKPVNKGLVGTIQYKLNHYLKDIRFKKVSGEDFVLNADGNIPEKFDVLNLIIYSNGTIREIHVGRFLPAFHKLEIYRKSITWGPFFNQTPTSTCSEPCASGHRRAHQKGKPSCCYDCIPCSDGKILNSTDEKICVKCPEDLWPNPTRNKCIPRTTDFLSYEDILGSALSGCASIFIVIVKIILFTFIKHRNTPIARANNLNISYMLLFSLKLSFLCTFLFIGRPTKWICFLRQAIFLFIYAISISLVLAKTITVLFAFKATKPRNKFRNWGGARISFVLGCLCSVGEFIICTTWLIYAPPFVDTDSKTLPGIIILQCNEGSITFFYLAISYIATLAFLCFLVAFIARKLPDQFNEAQHITFSMLVFCSVWASFIPTYLSTKGKHMVAVEIFAILASNAGLLTCIFAPKCYIILLKPHRNTKAKLSVKIKLSK